MSSYYFILSFILSEYHCIIFIYPRKERLDHWVIGYACVCIQSCVGADFSLQVAKKKQIMEKVWITFLVHFSALSFFEDLFEVLEQR